MPWLMMVLSRATTGRPCSSASRTSALMETGSMVTDMCSDLFSCAAVSGDRTSDERIIEIRPDGLRRTDGEGGGGGAVLGGRDRFRTVREGVQIAGEHGVPGAGDIDDGARDR